MGTNSFYRERTDVYTVNGMEVGPYLAHHGTKGMRWGVRRYQNPDGSLTAAGRVHYGYGSERKGPSALQKAGGAIRRAVSNARHEHLKKKAEKQFRQGKSNVRSLRKLSDDEVRKITDRIKNENALLSELENKQRHISNVRELKKNRTTLYSKYGDKIVNKVVDAALGVAKEKILSRDRFRAEQEKAVAEATQRGKNELAAIKLRSDLGLDNNGNVRGDPVSSKKSDHEHALDVIRLRNELGINNNGDRQSEGSGKNKNKNNNNNNNNNGGNNGGNSGQNEPRNEARREETSSDSGSGFHFRGADRVWQQAQQRAQEEANRRSQAAEEPRFHFGGADRVREQAQQRAREEENRRSQENEGPRFHFGGADKVREQAQQRAREEENRRSQESEGPRFHFGGADKVREQAQQRAREEEDRRSQESERPKFHFGGADKVREQAKPREREEAERVYSSNVSDLPKVRIRKRIKPSLMNDITSVNDIPDSYNNVENPFALMNFLGYL